MNSWGIVYTVAVRIDVNLCCKFPIFIDLWTGNYADGVLHLKHLSLEEILIQIYLNNSDEDVGQTKL